MIIAIVLAITAWGIWAGAKRLTARKQTAADRAEFERDLTEIVTCVAFAVDAGHVPRNAVSLGVTHLDTTAARSITARLAAGHPLYSALEVGSLAPTFWHDFASLISRAESDGADLRAELALLIYELRRHALAQVDETSGKLSVQLLIPLIFCVLPAFVAVTFIPLVANALSSIEF